jgi:signal transduction histidine kinase
VGYQAPGPVRSIGQNAQVKAALMVTRSILGAPVRRQAWAELAYVVVAAPVTLLGTAYVLACFLLGAGLAVTALGVPLLATAVPGTRYFAGIRRGLVRVLLGERVPPPVPFRPGQGLFAWLRAGLRDGPGWRAIGFHAASLPLSVIGLAVVVFTWAWGLVALTYPVQHAVGVNQMTAPGAGGALRHGLVLGDMVFDTWPELMVVSAGGVVLILLAPWAVRAVLLLDRLLVRTLLGPDDRSARIAALQRTRAHAVEDAAAMLRRIERDLHDGVQARLVALTMNLTVISETLGRDEEATRAMLGAARNSATEAIGDLREVIRGIHPPVLDSGLDAAIATLAARSPVPVDVQVDIVDRPSAAIETIAYFCVAELLTNVAKHSGATEAGIEVRQPEDRLRVVVTDNGRGGAAGHRGSAGGEVGGTGLRGLVDRVATVDGALDIVSPSGGPTVITVDLPLHP